MSKTWITIDGMEVDYQVIPGLLDRFNLLPNFLRNLIELKNTNNIKINKEQQINYFKKFLLDNNIKDKDQLSKWLMSNGLDDKRLDLLLYEKLKIERFKFNKFDNEVDKIFLDQKILFDQVIYYVLKVEKQAAALELYTQLEEKESTFAELASKYSLGSEKDLNGQVGPVEYRYIYDEIRERLLISKQGQLWPPFSIKNYWYILRHEKNIPCKLDDVMRKRIRDKLYEEWINKKVLKFIKIIRNIQDKEENLASNVSN